MTINELLEQHPNPTGGVFWTTKYNFKGGSSDFMYKHIKPSPILIKRVYPDNYYAQVAFDFISKKTGNVTSKSDTLYNSDVIFFTEEECNEEYKKRLQDHIDDKLSLILEQQKKIEVLRQKIDDL
jgi:hypothetical protein